MVTNSKLKYINTMICAEDKSTYDVHKNLAKDIINHIAEIHVINENNEKNNDKNNEKHSPQLIGIEGPWGSGKSNLIGLIKNEFKKDINTDKKSIWDSLIKLVPHKKHPNKEPTQTENKEPTQTEYLTKNFSLYMFIFNIWENQSAPIEKAFLKYLLDDLILNNILKGRTSINIQGKQRKEKWKDIFDIFTAKKQYEKSFLWDYIIIVSFLFSIINVVFDFSYRKTNSNFFSFLFDFIYVSFSRLWNFICSFVYIDDWKFIDDCELYGIAWILIGFILFIICLNRKILKLWFVKSSYSEVVNVGLYSNDFKSLFENISKELVKQKKILLITFDNIDRCDNEKVQEVLSLIYTIFSEHAYKNIWVILTYDYDKLAEVILSQQNVNNKYCQKDSQFESSNIVEINNKGQDSKGSINSTSNNSQENTLRERNRSEEFIKYNYVDGFLNKILPVIFRVPLPITLDFEDLFINYFKISFSDSVKDLMLSSIIKVYQIKKGAFIHREVISFINQLVSLDKREIFNNISIFSKAVYILCKRELLEAEDILSFSFPSYIEEEYQKLNISNEVFKNEISSLLYQVSGNIAFQIQIVNSLTKQIKESEENSNYRKDLNVWESPFLLDVPIFNQSVFEYIYYDHYVESWNHVFKYFSGESVIKRIFNIRDKVTNNNNFKEILNTIATNKIEDISDSNLTHMFAWQLYYFLFCFLQEQDKINKLIDVCYKEVSFLRDFCGYKSFNEDQQLDFESFLFLSIFLILNSMDSNAFIDSEYKQNLKKSFFNKQYLLLKQDKNNIGKIIYHILKCEKYWVREESNKSYYKVPYIETLLSKNLYILNEYDSNSLSAYFAEYWKKNDEFHYNHGLNWVIQVSYIRVFDFIEKLKFREPLESLYKQILEDLRITLESEHIKKKKEKIILLLRYLRQSSFNTENNYGDFIQDIIDKCKSFNSSGIIELIKWGIFSSTQTVYVDEPSNLKKYNFDISHAFADFIVVFFMFSDENRWSSEDNFLINNFMAQFKNSPDITSLEYEIKNVLATGWYGDKSKLKERKEAVEQLNNLNSNDNFTLLSIIMETVTELLNKV